MPFGVLRLSPVSGVEYRSEATKVGNRIRAARVNAGMSQDKLAQAIKTSRRNVLRWEGGYNLPRAEHIAAIAAATGQTTDHFLNGDDDDEEEDLYAALTAAMRAVARHEAEKLVGSS